jgi:hypothetical protein
MLERSTTQPEEGNGIMQRSYAKEQAAILEADCCRKGTHALEGGSGNFCKLGSVNKAYRLTDCSSSPSTSTRRSLIKQKTKKGAFRTEKIGKALDIKIGTVMSQLSRGKACSVRNDQFQGVTRRLAFFGVRIRGFLRPTN